MSKPFLSRTLSAGVLLACNLCNAQSLPELIDGVLSTHPSLRSQRALAESAKDAVEGAKWQFFPTPSIGFEQVNTGSTDPNYPTYGDKNVTTLRLQQPLPDGTVGWANVWHVGSPAVVMG